MNVDVGIGNNRLPEGPLAQMGPGLTNSRLSSVVSSDSSDTHHENEEYAEELWDELDVLLQAQEEDFVEQYEATPTGMLFDTPATPIVKKRSVPTSPPLSFQRQSAVPNLVSGRSLSPSLCPLSPTQPIVTDLKGNCKSHTSPPHLHVPLPSRGASVAGQSARTKPARESPSRRFFASPDQIEALGVPRSWLHGQVISTLGDVFCHISRSKPRHERYDVLPTNMFDLWNLSKEGHIPSQTCLSFHFKQAVSPLECRAWLIPVLFEHHWYLFVFDWIDCAIRIHDSLATNRNPPQPLIKFGTALLNLIAEDFEFTDQNWDVFPEEVSNFHCSLTRF